MTFIAGALFAACTTGDDDLDGGNNGGGSKGFPTDVVVDEPLFGGTVKAGYAGVVEITGEGFDPDFDYVKFGWEQDGKIVYSAELSPAFVLVKRSRITLGVHVDDQVVGKTVKVYLDRIGYDPMPLTDEIDFVLPEVSEGYIPDPGFRATLMSMHPQEGNAETGVAPMFNDYGLIPPALAATAETINLYCSKAESLEGLELFTHLKRIIAHDMASIKVVDFSKLKTDQYLFITMERGHAVEKIIAGPTISRLDCYDCDKLTEIDLHLNKWMHNLQCFSNKAGTYLPIKKCDLRRERVGEFRDKEDAAGAKHCDGDGQYTVLESGARLELPDGCHILVDYEYVSSDKRGLGNRYNYGAVLDAWKRGAKIDVYSSKNIEKFLGTVPMYADDPAALAPAGQENGWVPDEVE